MTAPDEIAQTLHILHEVAEGRGDPALLAERIAEDAVFHSPVLHTPQEGRALVMHYLGAALQMFSRHGFAYQRSIRERENAALEFTADFAGIQVNGVDLIRLDDKGMIRDFKVMIRPLKGIEAVRAAMLAQLTTAKAGG